MNSQRLLYALAAKGSYRSTIVPMKIVSRIITTHIYDSGDRQLRRMAGRDFVECRAKSKLAK